MLTSLAIKRFRALEDFKVDKLGRVNLIVGKNNSGKSTVLEALQIYAGNAQFGLLESIAAGHDEKFRLRDSDREDLDSPLPFEDLFTGRHFPPNDSQGIEIGDPSGGQMLSIQHGFYVEWRESVSDEVSGEPAFRIRRKRISAAELDDLVDESFSHALFVQKGERTTMLRFDLPNAYRSRILSSDLPGGVPCSVVPTQFISIDELADEWDNVALTDSQNIVKDALRLISPEFEDITFVRTEQSPTSSRKAFSRSAKVRLSNHDRPVSINSLGDGMLRVLQLVLKVFPARGGFLLVDEFENGLHYSVQEKVWGLIFELAVNLDIQVFATTHSWDCIESFARVATDRKDVEGVLFRVGRSVRASDQGKVIATVFDEDQLFNITQADVEVR